MDESALPYYQKHINNFSEAEIVEFIKLFSEPEFSSPLARTKPDSRVRSLANQLKAKTTNPHIIKSLDLIITAPPLTTHKINNVSSFKNNLAYAGGHGERSEGR